MPAEINQTPVKLAVIAGSGDLVKNLLDQLKVNPTVDLFVVGFEGITPTDFLSYTKSAVFKLGQITPVLEQLKCWGVSDLILLGAMKRPNFSDLSMDFKGMKWLARMGVKAFGDDGLLSSILSFLEEEGFTIKKPSDFLSTCVNEAKTLTTIEPLEEDINDLKKALNLLDQLSAFDIGQAVVIQNHLVLGIEAVEGTKELLKRVGCYKKDLNLSKGGVLVKCSKGCQDARVDVATIGPQTILDVKSAGLNGIFIKAQDVQVIDLNKVIELCEILNVFLKTF